MVESSNLTELRRDLRERLTQHYGDLLSELVLSGSQARGDADPASDVDVSIVLHRPVPHPGLEIDAIMDIVFDVSLEHDLHLTVLPVSEESYRRRLAALFVNIQREGVSL